MANKYSSFVFALLAVGVIGSCNIAKKLDAFCIAAQLPCFTSLASSSGLSMSELASVATSGSMMGLAATYPNMTAEDAAKNLLAYCTCNKIYISCRNDCDLYDEDTLNKCKNTCYPDVGGLPGNDTAYCVPDDTSDAVTSYVSFFVFALPVFALLFGRGQE